MIGLIEGSYEAYCYDQVSWYVVTTIRGEVEKVGQKKAKGQATQEAAQTKRLKQLLGQDITKVSSGQFADPAALFGKAPEN